MSNQTKPNQAPLVYCAFNELRKLESFVPHPRNPNHHNASQIELLAKIIDAQGWRAPIVVSERSGFIVAGHARLAAARKLGLSEAPVNLQAFATEAEEHAHLVADNRVAELAEIDRNSLADLLEDMDGKIDLELAGFDSISLADLLDDENEITDAEPKIDQAEELQKKWGTKLGQVWELGDHRIACGDSTAPETLAKLMGEEKAEMVFTDPPYNIDYNSSTNPRWRQDGKSIQNDSMTPQEWKVFCEKIASRIKEATDGCIYVCHHPNQDGRAIASILDAYFHCSTTIIWNKDVFTLGRGKYHNKYEPIWFGWVKSGKAFCDKRDLSNVWDIARPRVSELHPTIKPVEVVGRAIGHASKAKGIVFDPFLGSGTTLIACENLGRKCRAIELAPEYVAVAIERWHEATGKEPKLIS